MKKNTVSIPEKIFLLELNPYQISIYCHLVYLCRYEKKCTLRIRDLIKIYQVSSCTYRRVRDFLASPHPKLNGKSLINIEKRLCHDGSRDTDLITINEI